MALLLQVTDCVYLAATFTAVNLPVQNSYSTDGIGRADSSELPTLLLTHYRPNAFRAYARPNITGRYRA